MDLALSAVPSLKSDLAVDGTVYTELSACFVPNVTHLKSLKITQPAMTDLQIWNKRKLITVKDYQLSLLLKNIEVISKKEKWR